MAEATTAIEIKRDFIRVIQLRRKFKDIIVAGYQEDRLPFIPSLDLEENLEVVANKLLGLLQKMPVVSKRPIFIIPTSEIMVRFFDLPYLGKKERAEAVRYEAQKYIPFPIDDVVGDYYIPYEIKGKEMRIVYMAVKKEVLNAYIKIAGSLGINPLAIEPYPFSLLRALFTSGHLHHRDFVLILDLDYSGSTVLVTQGLNLYIARDFTFPLPSEAISEEDVLEKVYFEINRTIDYMIKEFPHQELKELILLGPMSSPSIKEKLSSRFNFEFKEVSLEGRVNAEDPEILKHLGLVGAGLRNLMRYNVDLDFFVDYKEKIKPEGGLRITDLIPTEFVKDLGLIAVGVLGLNFYLNFQFNKLSNIKSEFPSGLIKDKKTVNMQIKDIQEKISFYNNFFTQRVYLTNVLSFIPENLPPGIWLKDLEVKITKNGKYRVLLSGYGYDREARGLSMIYDFLEKLNTAPSSKDIFSEIKLTNVAKDKLDEFNVLKFALRMDVK
jgi:Tfp pilus assembly PilM family ATPase